MSVERVSESARYAGLKSCPHCDTQCASSTATETSDPSSARFFSASRSRAAPANASGVTNSRRRPGPPSSRGVFRSRAMRSSRAGSAAECQASASTPSSSHRRSWSRRRLRSGETTTVSPGSSRAARIAAGSMYSRLFPAPVGSIARQSLPSSVASSASRWPGLKRASGPRSARSAPSSVVASSPLVVTIGASLGAHPGADDHAVRAEQNRAADRADDRPPVPRIRPTGGSGVG